MTARELTTRRAVIVRRWVPHYRVQFYELLREELFRRRVRLSVVYSQPNTGDFVEGETVALPWGHDVPQHAWQIRGTEVCWQSALGEVRGADLVILEQASRNLLNYVLMAVHRIGGAPVAFWGHGRNFQTSRPDSVSERLKRLVSRRVHWWFAYNELSAKVVRDLGYAPERITAVQNAIDTHQLVRQRGELDEVTLSGVRADLRLGCGPVGVYCGSLYGEKRIDTLLAAADLVRAALPSFELLVIGDGPQAELVKQAAVDRPWVHRLGAKFGADRVPYFALADVFLLPGLVGLAVLDSFALEVPLVTSAAALHSPEIDYLEHDVNGLLVDDRGDPRAYSQAVIALLNDPQRLKRLQAGCKSARERYTVEAMAERFAEGVEAALDAPPLRRAARQG